jgi:hypothetical protein
MILLSQLKGVFKELIPEVNPYASKHTNKMIVKIKPIKLVCVFSIAFFVENKSAANRISLFPMLFFK